MGIKQPIDSIDHEHYVIILRKKIPCSKKHYQLKLFSPNNGIYEYSAVVTDNKNWAPKELLLFVSGRSAQETKKHPSAFMVNLLSFDVEEYFHGPAYSHIESAKWETLKPRIVQNMEKLLCILGKKKATFFVVGWIAEKYPDLLKKINEQGHEIACHSYMHKNIWDLSPREFRDDLFRTKIKIQEIIGTEIIGFRAPTFSITQKTYWALDVIRKVGFKYDSSIFPIYHDRYGIPDSPRLPYKIFDDFWEIPLSTIRLLGQNVPFGGGGYFRLYPYWLTNLLTRKINREGIPLVFYQHPWELDKSYIPKPKSLYSWLRRNLVIGEIEDKIKRLLQQHKFVTIKEYLKEG